MKKLILSLVAIATISLSSFGQAPEGIKYQAVVRDAGNLILNNQAVGMRMTIQQGSIGGTTVYQETFAPTTNGYGLVNLEIGSGTVVSGTFATIDWAAGPYFIETATDVTGGTSYAVMGTSQLMSVPYALHANTAENVTNDLVDDADADSTNEMNTGIVLNGTDLEVTDGNGTIVTDLSSLQDGVNDADADPTNELISSFTLSGTDLVLVENGVTHTVSLSAMLQSEIQSYVQTNCRVYFGWRDACGNCTSNPSKYGWVQGDGTGMVVTGTDCTFNGAGWLGIDVDGTVNNDDKFYIKFECD